MIQKIKINNKCIGAGKSTYIVAELSANHNQSFDEAVKLLHAAKEAGADAVKLQTYTADTLTLNSNKEYFRVNGGTLWDGKNLYQLYQEAYTPWEWQPKLKEIAEKIGINLFSTPFDSTSVDFLEKMGVSVYKIASFEVVDLPLIQKIAKTGKPIIMSTGMASLSEIEDAMKTIRQENNDQTILLKCTSAYPARPEEMNLNAMCTLRNAFRVPIGLSDHTLGIAVPVAAVALGACVVEKHFTLSRSVPGPDSAFSLEPHEFKTMVESIRVAEKALGNGELIVSEQEKNSRIFRRSLFVVKDVRKGETFTMHNVRSIRPAHGLASKYFDQIIGHMASKDIEAGTPLSWDLLQQ